MCQIVAVLHSQHPVFWHERRLAGVCWPQDYRLQRIATALLAPAAKDLMKQTASHMHGNDIDERLLLAPLSLTQMCCRHQLQDTILDCYCQHFCRQCHC